MELLKANEIRPQSRVQRQDSSVQRPESSVQRLRPESRNCGKFSVLKYKKQQAESIVCYNIFVVKENKRLIR